MSKESQQEYKRQAAAHQQAADDEFKRFSSEALAIPNPASDIHSCIAALDMLRIRIDAVTGHINNYDNAIERYRNEVSIDARLAKRLD